MKVGDKIRDMIKSFLKIEPAQPSTFTIDEELDFGGEAVMHKLWYRGRATELSQFYAQLDDPTQRFWHARSTKGLEIRKVHSGIPKIIVNTLANIVIRDMGDIVIENDIPKQEIWDAISDENEIRPLFKDAIKTALVVGDGAFKISIDSDISQYPIIEVFGGDRVELLMKRGRVNEVIFSTEYKTDTGKYELHERYGYGYVRYELRKAEKIVPLNSIEATVKLQDVMFDQTFMMAVPFKITKSDRWPGRGQSIFDGKTDNFDALDEAWSQWVHALRQCRPTRYIPDVMVPRDSSTGALINPNPFDNQFVATGTDMSEGAKNEIDISQPDFPSASYQTTYITALDLALQGVISPSTLGIDVKKLDNAEAQREKEKMTLYTRNNIIEAFTPVFISVVDTVLKAYNTALNQPISDTEASVVFGEYANPSFEAVVETLSNPNTPMSIESRVEEMWGDSKDQEWKDTEVQRIKEEQGVVSMVEPSAGVEKGATNDSDSQLENL